MSAWSNEHAGDWRPQHVTRRQLGLCYSGRAKISTIIKDGRLIDRQAGGFRQLVDEPPPARTSLSG